MNVPHHSVCAASKSQSFGLAPETHENPPRPTSSVVSLTGLSVRFRSCGVHLLAVSHAHSCTPMTSPPVRCPQTLFPSFPRVEKPPSLPNSPQCHLLHEASPEPLWPFSFVYPMALTAVYLMFFGDSFYHYWMNMA